MGNIYQEWTERIEKGQDQDLYSTYLDQETVAYQQILEKGEPVVQGTVKDLCEQWKMDPVIFAGFLEGIQSSLKQAIQLDELTVESSVMLDIDFEVLYYNMFNAKANWLYSLEEWENIFDDEQRESIRKRFNTDHIAKSNKVGRNEPCPCGSGKKYKKCCGA